MERLRSRSVVLWVVAAATASVVLVSCAPAESSAPTSTPSLSVPASPAPLSEDDPQAPVAAELTTDEAAAASAAASAVMTAFARTTVNAQSWINGLYPLLTSRAAGRHEGTNPQLVPVHEVTGPVVLDVDPTRAAAFATVPTDAGEYTLLMVWEDRAGVWLCDRIVAPQGDR